MDALNVLKAVINPGNNEALLIDGIETYPGYRIDWRALVESVLSDGDHEFYVCSCGEAGCAGLFTPQEIRYENNLIVWKVTDPEPEGEYYFDRDRYLDTIYDAFAKADALKTGEWEDFNIGPHGFYLNVFTKCLTKLKQWHDLRKLGSSWEEIAKKYPFRDRSEER